MSDKVKRIGRDSARFPDRLRTVKPAIKALWCRGNPQLLQSEKTVAIIGSRRISRYGKQVLGEIVPRFVEAGWVTISGFMYGIDIEVARLTYKYGGKHIAVVGWGIEWESGIEDKILYYKVIDEYGLVMTEIEGKWPPRVWTFPQRNRIVVGLAQVIVVVEAGEKSGSLNSASWARRLGKPIYAVPGNIFSATSAGTNALIEKGLAKALNPAVLATLTNNNNYSGLSTIDQDKVQLTDIEKTILTLLRVSGPLPINEIARQLRAPVNEAGSILTALALHNLVYEERGFWRSEVVHVG